MRLVYLKISKNHPHRLAVTGLSLFLFIFGVFYIPSPDGAIKPEGSRETWFHGKISAIADIFSPALYAKELPEEEEDEALTLPKTLSSSKADNDEKKNEEEISVWRVATPEPKETPKPVEKQAKSPVAPKSSDTPKSAATEKKEDPQSKTAENKTEPAKPRAKVNSKLVIPKDTEDVAFLEGCWDYKNHSAFNFPKIRYVYCFNKNGVATNYIDEYDLFGSIKRRCVGKVQASLSGGTLKLVDKEISCPGPHNYQPEVITCKMANDVKVMCSVVDINRGDASEATFTAVNYKR
jgi:hypothetical protein